LFRLNSTKIDADECGLNAPFAHHRHSSKWNHLEECIEQLALTATAVLVLECFGAVVRGIRNSRTQAWLVQADAQD